METGCRFRRCRKRRQSRKPRYNAKVDYWLRSRLPPHAKGFIDDFQSLQAKLLASHHGLYDESDLTRA